MCLVNDLETRVGIIKFMEKTVKEDNNIKLTRLSYIRSWLLMSIIDEISIRSSIDNFFFF